MKQVEIALQTIERAMIFRANQLLTALEADPNAANDDAIVGGVVGYRSAVEELGSLINDFLNDPVIASAFEQVVAVETRSAPVSEAIGAGFYL